MLLDTVPGASNCDAIIPVLYKASRESRKVQYQSGAALPALLGSGFLNDRNIHPLT